MSTKQTETTTKCINCRRDGKAPTKVHWPIPCPVCGHDAAPIEWWRENGNDEDLAQLDRVTKPVAEGASLAALQQRIVELEGKCRNFSEAYDRESQWRAAAEQRLAEVTRELEEAKETTRTLAHQLDRRASGADPLTRQLQAQLEAADATIVRVTALSEPWRAASRDESGKIWLDLRRCADELDAALAAPAAGTLEQPADADLCPACGCAEKVNRPLIPCRDRWHLERQAAGTPEQAARPSPDDVMDVYVPGAWKCLRCGFGLSQATIFMGSGEIGCSRDQVMKMTGESCPNDGEPMVRVTWRDRAEENRQWGESLMEDVIGAVHAEHLPGALAAVKRHYAALRSIAANSCCAGCREAKLVASQALQEPAAAGTEPTAPATDPQKATE